MPGPDVEVGIRVALDGSQSSDADGDKLTHSWRLVSAPMGSQTQLIEPPKLPAKGETVTHPAPTLVPDLPGVYQAELVVNDGSSKSDPDTVLVRASLPGASCGIAKQFGINTPDCPSSSGIPWKAPSQCAPDTQGKLIIGAGQAFQYVYVDSTGQGSFTYQDITISQGGRLVFLDQVKKQGQGARISLSSLHVSGGTDDGLPKGQLVIGTDQWPIQLADVTVTFTGPRPTDNSLDKKGIFVSNQGEVTLHGQKGVPGRAYAKVLEELWTGVSPTGAYWNHTRLVSDNRIAAGASDTTEYTFEKPAGNPATVRVRLLYRRAFKALMDQKKWKDVPDILMAEQEKDG
ncbi:MAG: G8 domain-containing protein [Thermodesulfobacteriota bacterium]